MSEAVAKCLDCGKPYEDFPLETVLPNDQWALINPALGGLLCANCMVARAAKLPHIIVAHLRLEFSTDAEPSRSEPRLKPPAPIGAIPTNPKDWDKEDWAILYNGMEDVRRKINERHAAKLEGPK